MFTVNGGAITATTRALDIDDNSGNITIGATLTTSGTAARSVEVTNRDGGTVDINGLVTDTSLGINLSTNGTGLVRFDGGINASTGANPAFASAVSGNLAITDTNGATAPNNTLTTTTGTALNVANTTIHADDLTFLSISAGTSGTPINGIVLTNTGTAGNLIVTGTGSTAQGGDNSGGTIQNTTGFGISLTNTTGPSFRNVRLLNTGDSGVNGTQVNGFSFTDGTITGAGDASDENSITFDDSLTATPNLTGAVTIYEQRDQPDRSRRHRHRELGRHDHHREHLQQRPVGHRRCRDTRLGHHAHRFRTRDQCSQHRSGNDHEQHDR